MKRRLWMIVVSGLVLGCAAEEPEDASTTAASSVGMTTGVTGGEASSSGGSGEGSSSSGGSDSGSSGAVEVDYEADVQPILNGCTCHLMGESGEMAAPFLTLNPSMSYAELVGVPAEQAALARIEPGDPEQSYLWLKINGAHDDVGSGTIMPPIGVIGDAQIATIEAWILAGAEP